jgi:hypothetical protein
MKSIFSVHFTLGVVDPQFSTDLIAELVEALALEHGVPIGCGVAVVVPRPFPNDEEEEAFQAISPGTHEVNFIFDFDPNGEGFRKLLSEDTMSKRYNAANQLCSTIVLAALEDIECTPTYFSVKICGDYVDDEVYEKMKKHRFNR